MISTVTPSSTWLRGIELDDLSDEAYFMRCRAVGLRVRQDDDRYIGLLVGVFDRNLAPKRGFRDIFHMAGVQARMPRKRVTEVLSIARAIRSCPALFRLFTRAEASWTKVRAVARLASPERDTELCDVVLRMTRVQLESWIREQSPRPPRPAVSRTLPSRAGSSEARPGTQAPAAESPTSAPGVRPGDAPSSTQAHEARDAGCAADGAPAPEAPRTIEPSGELGGRPATPEAPDDADHTDDRVSRGPARVGARALEAMLLRAGVDPLVLDKLRIDREALAVRDRATPPLIEVLEQAIREHRPAGRSVRLPYLHVILTCPQCGCRTVSTTFGGLPVDGSDARHLRQSGAPVNLDPERAAPGLANVSAAAGLVERGADTAPAHATGVAPEAAPGSAHVDARGREPVEPRRPPALMLRLVLARQGGRCAVPRCLEILGQCHHRTPFVWTRHHDADQLHWICRRHHDLLHGGGIANPGDTPDLWRPRRGPDAVDARHQHLEQVIRSRRNAPRRRDEALARGLLTEPRDEPVPRRGAEPSGHGFRKARYRATHRHGGETKDDGEAA